MNLAEIKQAIADGKRVFWSNTSYEVIKDSIGQYLIGYDIGGRKENYIGLTWQDGVTLNGDESEFMSFNPTSIVNDLTGREDVKYTVKSENDCRCKTSKSAYQEFVRSFGQIITMGKIIVEPA